MNIILKSREYRAGNIRVSFTLCEVKTPQSKTYQLVEEFVGTRGVVNTILRGIYNDEGVGRIEFGNMVNRLSFAQSNMGILDCCDSTSEGNVEVVCYLENDDEKSYRHSKNNT